jgi:hypothetical protein
LSDDAGTGGVAFVPEDLDPTAVVRLLKSGFFLLKAEGVE